MSVMRNQRQRCRTRRNHLICRQQEKDQKSKYDYNHVFDLHVYKIVRPVSERSQVGGAEDKNFGKHDS
jgi:hypothetical protein